MWAWLLALFSSYSPPRAVRGVGDASTPINKATSSDDTDTEAELGPTAALPSVNEASRAYEAAEGQKAQLDQDERADTLEFEAGGRPSMAEWAAAQHTISPKPHTPPSRPSLGARPRW